VHWKPQLADSVDLKLLVELLVCHCHRIYLWCVAKPCILLLLLPLLLLLLLPQVCGVGYSRLASCRPA
jgi:hypothetical protein